MITYIANLLKLARDKTTDCAVGARSVTLDEAITTPSRGIYVGGTGDVSITFVDGHTEVLPGMVAGIIHPISAVKINTTGTTATGLKFTF